jgi:hypothetical protein
MFSPIAVYSNFSANIAKKNQKSKRLEQKHQKKKKK